MTYQEVEETIMKIFDEIFGVKVTTNLSFSDTELDSLDKMDLIVALEHNFKISIPDDFLDKLINTDVKFSDIVSYVCEAKNIKIAHSAQTIKPTSKPAVKEPIRLVPVNNKSIEFHQGDKTLNLNNPKIAQIIQSVSQQLRRQKQ